jgi:hypothetical protein
MGLNALLSLLLTDLVLFFNVGKIMSPAQIAQTVALILEDYDWLCIEDLKVCFNNAKKGVYGKLYDRIDGQVILEWIDAYARERLDACHDINGNPTEPPRLRVGCTVSGPQTIEQAIAKEFNSLMQGSTK